MKFQNGLTFCIFQSKNNRVENGIVRNKNCNFRDEQKIE